MFIISNCDSSHQILHIDYLLLNPDDEHLSSSDTPKKTIHTVNFILWALLFIAFLIYYIKTNKRYFYLHFLFATIILMLAYSFNEMVFWNTLSSQGSVPFVYFFPSILGSALAFTMMFLMSHLICMGYRISLFDCKCNFNSVGTLWLMCAIYVIFLGSMKFD